MRPISSSIRCGDGNRPLRNPTALAVGGCQSQVFIDAVAFAYFDIFRLANGQIVEHYTNKEVVLDRL